MAGKKGFLIWFGRLRLIFSRLVELSPLALAGVAILLALPALGTGLQFDDYIHQRFFQRQPGLPAVLMDFFRFLDKDPALIRAWIEQGLLPWWTVPEAQITFWRPLAALTHWLDYQGWPQLPVLMHAHSLFWFGALITIVTLLYRQLFQREVATPFGAGRVAGLAALLYALDEAHGFPVGWLANRNILLATLFASLSLLAYDRWRRGGWGPGAWLAPLCFLLGLLSAEAAIAIAAYLLAHALFLDQAPWFQRGLALLPVAGTGLAWQLIYRWLGYGAYGTAYTDPLAEPLRYLSALIEHGPLLLLGQFFLPPPEFYLLLRPAAATGVWLLALAGLGLLGLSFWPLLRTNNLARFWVTGLLLSLFPACVILPAGRLLFFTGLGATGLVALFLAYSLEGDAQSRPLPRTKLNRIVASLFILLHLIVAPLGLPLNAFSPVLAGSLEPAIKGLPDEPALGRQTLVIVTAPSAFYPAFIPHIREQAGQVVPARIRLLASGLYPVKVRRLDARTLQLRPETGYLSGMETVFRGRDYPMELNQPISLSGMTIWVTGLTPDGRPAEAQFQFVEPLEADVWRWVYWQNGAYHPFPLPGIGEQVEISVINYSLFITH